MWALRILNGPQAGTNYPLKEGENLIGRASGSDIQLQSNGISKTHCKIVIEGTNVIVLDQNSSNGTFVNGRLVKEKQVQDGDKISVHDTIIDLHYNVIPFPNGNVQNENVSSFENENPFDSVPTGEHKESEAPATLKDNVEKYVENVVMPSVYRLIELFELKWVLGCFVLAFILLVSSLSTIPMIQITQSSIEKESQRRALTIARNIVYTNERLIQQGLTSSLTVSAANREEGVKLAAIIEAKSGRILAPASKAGSFENIPFLNVARDIAKYKHYEFVDTMNDKTIGASVPIRVYNPSQQTTNVYAFAVVIYDISALSIDQGKTISLLVQTLAIACLLGFILFFFMVKLIEKPISVLNRNIDQSIKDGTNISNPYQFPILNDLITNINSMLARLGSGGASGDNEHQYVDKTFEAQNLVRLFEEASFAVQLDNTMIDCNPSFESLLGTVSGNIQNQPLEELNDQAFILCIQDLIDRCKQQPSLIASNSLEFNGMPMEIDAQAISGNKGIEFFIFTIKQQGGIL